MSGNVPSITAFVQGLIEGAPKGFLEEDETRQQEEDMLWKYPINSEKIMPKIKRIDAKAQISPSQRRKVNSAVKGAINALLTHLHEEIGQEFDVQEAVGYQIMDNIEKMLRSELFRNRMNTEVE